MSDGTDTNTRQLIESLLGAINGHDVDRIVELYSPEVTNHGIKVGRAGMRAVHEAIFGAFPDWTVVGEELMVTETRAVLRGRLRGHYSAPIASPLDRLVFGGALADVPATGQLVDVDAIHIWGVADGAIDAHWAVRDDLSIRRQAALPSGQDGRAV